MNAKQLITIAAVAALSGFGTSIAFAQEATPDTWKDVQLSKTRAEVQAELVQARADGSIKFGSAGYIERVASVKSRTEMRGAVALARDSGELAAINGEVYTFTAKPAVLLAKSAR